jgi:hypothetical protein
MTGRNVACACGGAALSADLADLVAHVRSIRHRRWQGWT